MTPDEVEREFVEKAKAWHLELLKEHAKEVQVVVPQYERGA